MNRLIMILSLLAISTLLFFGVTDPNSPVMWLAATTRDYTILRAIMAAVIVLLLITKPPRNQLFRIAVGVFSSTLAYWSLSQTYQNHMAFLDTLTMLTFSISCGLAVAELDEAKMTRVQTSGLRRLTVSLYTAYTLHNGKL